ncbi:gliding motility-associated C-terminal domain-containing protein [Lewinella sp. 4G2]|uniref:T9SS type B sorting domain-containing protein n=1 Tax=Lewinella sp. 4G2 TaxID=1803372 RepID=UPI0018D475A3|nr:gliding motility-associated C-terminal domain-containing protein [Lewinella sp. 4G2]
MLVLLGSCQLSGQVANDECANATELPMVLEYCSGVGAFSNINATTSLEESAPGETNRYPTCIENKDEIRDVWFSFVAQRNAANISVNGATAGNEGGTLEAPQFAVIDGTCTSNYQDAAIGCRSPFVDPNTGEAQNGGNVIVTGLVEGRTYLINVSSSSGDQGSFELCVNQFDQVPSPSSDCATGVLLCDKRPFSVDFLSGRGDVLDDLLPSPESCGRLADEFNSAWYKWTCDDPGTLAFTITPLGPAFNEDLDFVIYEFGNGLDDCNGRTVLREMYSGESIRQDPADNFLNLPCLRETGLSLSDPDLLESCGCQEELNNNNFAAAIDMVSGRSYALVVMNFSGSGDGFSINWSGSGTFLGPNPEFTSATGQVCVGEELVFEDASTSVDAIISREWDFGPTATPRTATGPGPHTIVFGESGNPDVELIIETDRGCREVASRQTVEVVCCDSQFPGSAVVTPLTCPGDFSGAIDLSSASTFSPTTTTYTWSNGETTEDLSGLDVGTYTVTVGDESNCERVFSFDVTGPPAFTFDTTIVMPDCGGFTNGSFAFEVTGGGEGPYTYSVDGGPFGSATPVLTDIGISTVNVRVRDANGCPVEQDILVDERQLGLFQGEDPFTEPTCNGDDDGRIDIRIQNGIPNYEYDFRQGAGFQADSFLTGLTPGLYTVEARDVEGCTGIFDITITEPPVITLGLTGESSSCFQANDGILNISAGGGRPDYAYEWSDGMGSGDTLREGLPQGLYTVSVTDDNGCLRTTSLQLTDPTEVVPEIINVVNLRCFGLPEGSFELAATGGSPGYTYSADGINFSPDSLLGGLPAGDFTLYVQDANGCTDSVPGSLTQPPELIIDPGSEGTITLGFDTILRAFSTYDPVSFQWGPDSVVCLDPPLCTRVSAQPVVTTDYVVVGTNLAGCTDTALFKLNVIEDRPVYAPTAFSPNGDGINDGFTIYGGRAVAGIESLRVYHRWGGLVFERGDFAANDASLGWDGRIGDKEANAAVFVYVATVRFVNNTVRTISGDVTLTR